MRSYPYGTVPVRLSCPGCAGIGLRERLPAVKDHGCRPHFLAIPAGGRRPAPDIPRPGAAGWSAPHPAALCGCESVFLPGHVARIAQAAAETRRVGHRPDVRPEVPAAGWTAAGDGVSQVMQRSAQITDGGSVEAKTVCRPGFPERVPDLACAGESLIEQVMCCRKITGGHRGMTEQREPFHQATGVQGSGNHGQVAGAAYAGGGVNPPIRPARVWANMVTVRSCR